MMEEGIGAISGFLVGFFMALFLIVLYTDPVANGTYEKINQCQLNLPRTQTCELVAVPKEVE